MPLPLTMRSVEDNLRFHSRLQSMVPSAHYVKKITAVLAGFVLLKKCHIFRNKEQKWQFLPKIKNTVKFLSAVQLVAGLQTAFQLQHLQLSSRSPKLQLKLTTQKQ